MMDNAPLRETLRKGIALDGIGNALRSNTIDALAVTGSSYTSGVHWTFCHTASREEFQGWSRPGRRAEYQPLTIDHLMASSNHFGRAAAVRLERWRVGATARHA